MTVSRLLSAKMEGLDRGSMLDLKTLFRARKYTRRILNSLGKTAIPSPISMGDLGFGRHPARLAVAWHPADSTMAKA